MFSSWRNFTLQKNIFSENFENVRKNKNSDYQKKCDDYKNIANWRIKHDNTIEYSYKGIDLPLVCSYRPKYFNQERIESDFYEG